MAKWSRKKVDATLDLVLMCIVDPKVAAQRLHTNRLGVYNLLTRLMDNPKEAASYQPTASRILRVNQPFTEMEWDFIKHHADHQIPPNVTATILQRTSAEIRAAVKELPSSGKPPIGRR